MRAQISAPQRHPARAGVPPAPPPEPSPRSPATQTWPRPTRRRRRRLSAERRGGAGWLGGGSAGGRGRAGGRPQRSSGRRAQTRGPAPEGASAAPGSARSRRARGLRLAAWSATLGAHPPPRWGPSPREDGVLDHLQSRGVSAAHGAPEPPTRGPG